MDKGDHQVQVHECDEQEIKDETEQEMKVCNTVYLWIYIVVSSCVSEWTSVTADGIWSGLLDRTSNACGSR